MTLTDEQLVPVPGLLSRRVRLEGGEVAHYVTSGETGPAIVLLHGGLRGSSGTAGWRHMAPFLGANGFRVYCPDLPGFGLSDARPEHRVTDYQVGHTRFLRRFADALALDRLHLGGNSMGCGVTVAFTLAHPERVISFALVAGNVGDLCEMPEHLRDAARPPGPFDGSEASMRRLLASITFDPDTVDDDLVAMRTLAANRNAASYDAWVASRQQVLAEPNRAQVLSTRHRLPVLDVPGIYLYGRQDVLQPVAYGHLQEAALPRVQFFFPDQCGHQGQTDQPRLFNQVFLEFFRDGRVSRATADQAGVSANRPEIRSLVEPT